MKEGRRHLEKTEATEVLFSKTLFLFFFPQRAIHCGVAVLH
jgi:hypothetical protein